MPSGPGHWERRTRITVVNGKKKATTYRVWVKDPPKNDAGAARAKARADAAKRRAQLAAKARAAAAEAKKKAEEHAAYQRTLAERRRASVLALRERAAARNRQLGIIREQKVAAAEAPAGAKAPDPRHRPLVSGRQYRREAMKRSYAQRYATQTKMKNEADAKAAAEVAERQRLLGGPRTLLKGGRVRTPADKPQESGIKEAKDAQSAERIIAEETKRVAAGKGSMSPEDMRRLAQNYIEYANTIADKYTVAVGELQSYLDKADDKTLTPKQRERWWKKAKALYEGSFKSIMDEYVRLNGSGRNQNQYKAFVDNLDAIALQQREWWKRQTKASLNSITQRMRNDPEVSPEDREYYETQKRIFSEDPKALGMTIDHWQRDPKTGKAIPIYRPKTIEEALEDQQAQYILKMQEMWAEQQAKANRIATDHGRHGLVQSPTGKWVKAKTASFEREIIGDLRALYEPGYNPMHDPGMSAFAGMPNMPRDADVQRVANDLLRKWGERNPEPPKYITTQMRGGGSAQQLSPQWVDWNEAREAHEQKVYRYLTVGEKGTPHFLERVFALPGISHALSAFTVPGAGIGAGGRVLMYVTTGSSTINLSLDVAELPKHIQKTAAIALTQSAFMASGDPNSMYGGSISAQVEAQKELDAWLATPEGKKWVHDYLAKQKAQSAMEDAQFAAVWGGNGDIGAKVDALNAYGSEPFGDAASNLLFQLLADPTNAIPLKFTTYLARAQWASKTLAGASKVNPINWARFTRNFVAVDEGVLRLEKELGKYESALRALGVDPKEAAEDLRRILAGLADPNMAQEAFTQWAVKLGLDPRKLTESQIFNIAEWAVTKEASEKGNLLTQRKDLLKRVEARKKAEKAAIRDRKAKQEAAREADEARRADAQERVDAAQERLAIKRESDIERQAAEVAAQRERTAAAEAGRSAARAAREPVGTAPARPTTRPRRGRAGVAKPKPMQRPRPTHPVQLSLPRYKGGILTDRLREVHARVEEKVPAIRETRERVRRQRSYEGFDEYYDIRDGQLLPKDRNLLREQWWTPQVKAWVKAAKAGDEEAKIALARHAQMVRNMWRTAIEDVSRHDGGVKKTKFTPSFKDVADRAGVLGDVEGEERLLANLEVTRHLQRTAAQSKAPSGKDPGHLTDPYVMGFTQELDEAGNAGRINRDLMRGKVDYDIEEISNMELSGMAETGFQIVEAKNSFRGLRGIFSPFNHESLLYYKDMPGPVGNLMRNLMRNVPGENGKMAPWVSTLNRRQMIYLLRTLSQRVGKSGVQEIDLGEDFVAWRDGGMAMFEIFHQLRLAKDWEKMREFDALVDLALEADPHHIYAWQWKVMQHRSGLPGAGWTYEEAMAGFKDAARTMGIDPELSLASIPNGYHAQEPPHLFRMSRNLRELEQSDLFVPAPWRWNESIARKTLTKLFLHPDTTTIPSQIVHYTAKRFGDFTKGSPMMNRLIGELGHVALKLPDNTAFIDAVASHLRPDGKILSNITRRMDGLREQYNIPASVSDDAAREILRKRGEIVPTAREVVASSLRLGDRPTGGFRPDFHDLKPEIWQAYWDGMVPVDNPLVHELMYLTHLQNTGPRDAIDMQTRQFLKYMREIGQTERGQKFVQAVRKTEFENLGARYRAEHAQHLAKPIDPLTGKPVVITEHEREVWRMWEEAGFDLEKVWQKNKDEAKTVAAIRREANEIEQGIAAKDEFIEHERDLAQGGGVGLFTEARFEKMVENIEKMPVWDQEGEDILVSMLAPLIREIADMGAAGITASDNALLADAIAKVRAIGPRGISAIERVADEIGSGVLAERRNGALEALAYEEARIRFELEVMKVKPGTRVSMRNERGYVMGRKNKDGKWVSRTKDITGEYQLRYAEAAAALEKRLDDLLRVKRGVSGHAAPPSHTVVGERSSLGSMDLADKRQIGEHRGLRVLAVSDMARPGSKPRRKPGAARQEIPLTQRVAARFDRATGAILLDEPILRRKFETRAWTRSRKFADGSMIDPQPRGLFRTYDEFRRFTLEHEYQHSIHPKQPDETRAAYEVRINGLALDEIAVAPRTGADDLRRVDQMRDEYIASAQANTSGFAARRAAFVQAIADVRAGKVPIDPDTGQPMTAISDQHALASLRKRMAALTPDDAPERPPINMADEPLEDTRVLDDEGPVRQETPPTPEMPPPVTPDPVRAAATDAKSQLLERLLGMGEQEWWEWKRQELRKVVFNRKSTPAQKMAARETLNEISLVQFGETLQKRRGTHISHRQRNAHRNRTIRAHGNDALEFFPDRIIAPHALNEVEATVEQVRTWNMQLKRRPVEIADSDVLRLGSGAGRDIDYFPIELFDEIEQKVARAIRSVHGYTATKLTQRKGIPRKSMAEGVAKRAAKKSDTDIRVIRAKRRVLQQYGISIDAYDEARKILHRGYVQRRTNLYLIKEAQRLVDEAAAAGKTLDHKTEYRRLRHERAQVEANSHLGTLAYGEMYGADPDQIWSEFQRRYGFDHELHYPAWPMSSFQIRTLEEAIKVRSGMDDIDNLGSYLASANRPPFEKGREAVREWLKDTGAWSPRVHDDFVEGKRSWGIDEEAEYWQMNYGETPDWTNRGLLESVFNEIFHNDELYFLQMRSWGIFNRSNELKLRLDGTNAAAIERARVHGDPALDIPARRELEDQRRYVIQRYGDLVGEELGDGNTKLTSMPWLMYPDEIEEYLARRAGDHGIPEGLIQSKEELDEVVSIIQETMKPLMERLLASKAGAEITYEDIYAVSSEVLARVMADPVWRKRWRDRLVGDPLNLWTKFNRWMIFSNPSFAAMNMVDVPIKMAWYRMSRAGLFDPHLFGLADDALERAKALTPAHLGLDAETTIYKYKQRSALDYFKNPRKSIRVGPFVIDEAAGIGKPILRAIEYTEGAAHSVPEMAGMAELKGKMIMARRMYPQVYSRALQRLGDPELADVWARKFVRDEISRMWPTAGDGVFERFWNRLVPFSSYTVRNKVLFISEVLANPVFLNRIEYIGRFIEQHNLREWEKKYPGTEMPGYLRRRLELPWARDFYIDLGSFSDATRGLKPLYDSGNKTPVQAVAEWVRVINPSSQAAIYMATNAMGLTKKLVYVPILENGYPTGRYEKKYIGWTEPWSNEQPDVASVFWFADVVKSMQEFGKNDWTTGELSQMVGQVFMFNAISTFDRGTVYFQMFKAMEAKDAEAAQAWLMATPEGRFLKDWMQAKASAPRETINRLVDIERAVKTKEWQHWFSLSNADRLAIKAGRARLKGIRDAYATRLLTMTPGTQEYTETKAKMYYEINREYMMNEALMREEVWSKTPAEWAAQTTQWQTDKLTDDYMAMSAQRPQRSDYETGAEYRKAVEEWEQSLGLFLKTYPQVEKQLAGGIAELDAARDKMNEMWDQTLDRIAARNEMIEDAKADLEKFGYGTEEGDAAQDRLDILYLQNELDYSLLDRDYAAVYFTPQDYERLPGRDQTGAPLRAGITMPRASVLRDFNTARYEKARREGTLDDFLAKEEYGRDMKKAILYAKSGDPFGEFSGARFYNYMQKHPELMGKYFDNNDGKKAEWAESSWYISGMRKAVEFAGGKWGGKGKDPNFDPAKWVKYMKAHPKLLEAYFKRHKGKREEWARTEAYIRHISVWGKLIGAGRWDEANDAWDALPPWVKEQYYKNNPGARKRRQQTAQYLGYMKKWISLFNTKDKKAAMAYFNSLPQWAKDRYYKKHPEKRAQYETSAKMFAKLKDYFSSETEAGRAAYLRENPDLARWLARNASTKEKERWAIIAAYQNIPKEEAWLRKVFRERYPEIFSQEAIGERKLRSVYARLRAHPEMSAGFEAWVKAITESYAEMLKKGTPRPANTYIEMDRKVLGRHRSQSLSAAEASK